jgi:hypothetical protein
MMKAYFRTAEGKMFSPSFGLYVAALVGIGDDKAYDLSVGVLFNYQGLILG